MIRKTIGKLKICIISAKQPDPCIRNLLNCHDKFGNGIYRTAKLALYGIVDFKIRL